MKPNLPATAFLFFVSGMMLACGSNPPKLKSQPPTVQVAKAETQAISQVVTAEGELFAFQQASLSPKIASPISKYFVIPGQKVHKGQLLAVLENRDLAANVRDAQGTYEQAKANYTATTSATVPQELEKAQSDVNNAKVNLEAQQKLYDNRVALYKTGAIAGKLVDDAAVTLATAKAQYQTALKQLETLQKAGAAAAEQSAAGLVQSAQAKEQGAKVQLAYTQLRSPINGVVAYRNLYPGDIAPAGTALITIMNVSRVTAKLHLPQSESLLVRVGDPATLKVAGADHELPGKVVVRGPALDPNSTTAEVWVEAPNPNSELQPGSSAQVSITTRTVPNAVVVPSSAILTGDNGATEVLTLDSNGKVKHVDVKIGIQNGDSTEVVAGIQPGEQVVSNGGYGIPDGTKVTVSNPPDNSHSAAKQSGL